MPMMSPRRIYGTPASAARIRARLNAFRRAGTRLGTGRSPMILRSGRAIGMYNPYVRAGVITAAGLAAARAGLRRAGPIIRARRSGLGKTPGTATSKRTVVKDANAQIDTRTLYNQVMNDIGPTVGGGTDINLRERDMVRLTGVKLCMELKNNADTPIYFNWALVYDKRSNDTVGTVSVADFFRGNGSTRAKDFGTDLSAIEFHCNPLNSDRFTVLKHERHTLGKAIAGTTNYTDTKNSFKSVNRWIPIKRQIRYEDGEAQSKVWLLYWCDRMLNPPAQAVQLAQIDIQEYHVTYFRDVK